MSVGLLVCQPNSIHLISQPCILQTLTLTSAIMKSLNLNLSKQVYKSMAYLNVQLNLT